MTGQARKLFSLFGNRSNMVCIVNFRCPSLDGNGDPWRHCIDLNDFPWIYLAPIISRAPIFGSSQAFVEIFQANGDCQFDCGAIVRLLRGLCRNEVARMLFCVYYTRARITGLNIV